MMTSKGTSTKTAGRTTTSQTKKNVTPVKVTAGRLTTICGSTRTTFPSSELNKWLRTRTYWNHEDWLHLLTDLRQSGYSCYTETETGKTEIGNYLETHRSR